MQPLDKNVFWRNMLICKIYILLILSAALSGVDIVAPAFYSSSISGVSVPGD